MAEIGSFDDFSSRHYDSIVISHCKTDDVVKSGGPLINSPLLI